MKKLVLVMAMLVLATTFVAAEQINIVSDNADEFWNGAGWNSAVACWVHPSWPIWQSMENSTWIWTAWKVSQEESVHGANVTFIKTFEMPECAKDIDGQIQITSDNAFKLFVNGNYLGSGANWGNLYSYVLGDYLQSGVNTLIINATNWAADWQNPTPDQNPGSIIYSAKIDYDCDPEVPEFGTFAAFVAFAGAVAAFFVVRK